MNKPESIINSILTDCTAALVCPRGEFYPDKDYGSRIRKEIQEIDLQTLLSYSRQALSDMDGIFVISAEKDDERIIFNISINDDERQVFVPVEQDL